MSSLFPSLDHFTLADAENVYEPSDDTYLLCDAIESDINILKQINPTILVEIGSGSGCVITFVTSLCKQEGIKCISMGIDINRKAAEMTIKTASSNKCSVETVLSDLAVNFRSGLVDVLIFNPPYVPTPSEEVHGHGIEAVWAGGVHGREVIDRFLPMIATLLSPSGVCYLLLVQDNKPLEIQSILFTSYLLKSKIIMRRQAKNEHLLVMRINR